MNPFLVNLEKELQLELADIFTRRSYFGFNGQQNGSMMELLYILLCRENRENIICICFLNATLLKRFGLRYITGLSYKFLDAWGCGARFCGYERNIKAKRQRR